MVIQVDETGKIISIERYSDNRYYKVGDITAYGTITGFRIQDRTVMVCFRGPSQYGIKGLWHTVLQNINFL